MCGRYSRDYTWAEVHAFSQGLRLSTPAADPEPAYNVAPTQPGWVLVPAGDGAASAQEMRWGIIPVWAKDAKIAYSTINARVETADTKPAFRAAWKSRRCLIPASGYYEWPGEGAAKQPYYIHSAAGPLLIFAGLWEPGRDDRPATYSIVTRDAEGPVATLHDRMPLMLPVALLRDWIEGGPDDAAAIAHSAPIPDLAWHAVGKAVGNARNQGRQLIEPVQT